MGCSIRAGLDFASIFGRLDICVLKDQQEQAKAGKVDF